jgi:hypothetical protein
LRREPDLVAVAQENGPAKSPADQIPDVVADDAADPGKQQQQGKRHVAVLGHDRREDQQRFPRQRRAQRFERDDGRDDDESILPDQRVDACKQVLDFGHERRSPGPKASRSIPFKPSYTGRGDDGLSACHPLVSSE